MVGLSLQSDALAADPVENVSLGLTLRGTVYPVARRLELERAEARVRDVTARVSRARRAARRGRSSSRTASSSSVVPDIDLAFSVPRVACAKLLTSIPSALVPRLQGFVLQGIFAADVGVQDRLRPPRRPRSDRQGRHRRLQGGEGARPTSRRSAATRHRWSSTSRCRSRSARRPRPSRTSLPVVVGPRQPRLRPLRSDLAVSRRLDHDHRGQRLLQAPRLGQLGVQERAAPQPASGADSGWARRRSPCR